MVLNIMAKIAMFWGGWLRSNVVLFSRQQCGDICNFIYRLVVQEYAVALLIYCRKMNRVLTPGERVQYDELVRRL